MVHCKEKMRHADLQVAIVARFLRMKHRQTGRHILHSNRLGDEERDCQCDRHACSSIELHSLSPGFYPGFLDLSIHTNELYLIL